MKLIFASLINNLACITGARKRKWWISIILVLISLIFSLVPTFVQTITTKGNTVLFSSSTYGLENALLHYVEDNSSNSLVVKVDADGKTKYLDPTGFSENSVYTWSDSTNNIDYNIYVMATDSSDSENTTAYNKKDGINLDFGRTSLRLRVNGNDVAICSNSWNSFDENTDLLKFFVPDQTADANSKYSVCYDNLKTFADKVYNYNRVVSAFSGLGIYAAVNFTVTLLMGLMIWILTRGKNNFFRDYTLFDGLKIAFWASLAPGILSLPLGFLIKRFATMLYVLLIGMRCMWLASNTLRPDGSGLEPEKK